MHTRLHARILAMAATGLIVVPIMGLAGAPTAMASAESLASPAGQRPGASTKASTPNPHHHDESAFTGAAYSARAATMPEDEVAAINRDLGISAADYSAQGDAAASAVATVDWLTAAGVTVLGSSIHGTTLTVNVATAREAAMVAAAGGTPKIGAPVRQTQFDDLDVVTTSSTLLGGSGYLIPQPDGTLSQCSVAFNGFSPTGVSQFLTAGHCLVGVNESAALVKFLQKKAGSHGNQGDTIGRSIGGSVQNGPAAPGFDVARVATDAGQTALAGVEVWGTSGSGSPEKTAPAFITGQSAAIVGANLCKSGSRTGWTCGVIEAVDHSTSAHKDLDKPETGTVNSIVATACALPGDSGGAAMTGTIALGIASGSTTATTCGPKSRSTYFPLVSSAAKASVSSAYGADWELAVTVAAPEVTRLNGGTIAAPGEIDGTVSLGTAAALSDGTTVELFVDGATDATATVLATEGAFALPLPSLPAGKHQYTLQSTRGKHSHSAAVTGSFETSGDTSSDNTSDTATPTTTESGADVSPASVAAPVTAAPATPATPATKMHARHSKRDFLRSVWQFFTHH